MKKSLVFVALCSVFLYADCARDNKSEIVTCQDKVLGTLIWQDDSSVKSVEKTWSEAKKHCKNLTLGGHSDWRLPTLEELRTIIDYGAKPAINSVFKNIENANYWSSTSDASSATFAWFVHFMYGYDSWDQASNANLVRCVR